jgi:molybdopterin-guanine dinucleotide biosynthesis protein A
MGMEKGLVPFKGTAMINYAIKALEPVCQEILISANSAAYGHLGYKVVADEKPGCGPMGGIYSCLHQSTTEINFVLTCDMPLVDDKLVARIIDESTGFDACVPWHGGNFFEPLCAVYKKSLMPVFSDFIAQKNFRIPDLINQVNCNKLKTGQQNDLDPMLFFNVNSQKDLQQLEEVAYPKQDKESRPEIPLISNLLMIAGTGRNVGKTTFACNLISHFSKNQNVTAIKISPHLHQQADGQKVIASEADFQIIEETKPSENTDSSRMLNAGASKVYYLQTHDRNIKAPFDILLDLIPKGQPVICESGALVNHAKPGLFLLIKKKGQTAFKKGLDQLRYEPDTWVTFFGDHFSMEPDGFDFDDNRWRLRQPGS